MKVKFSHLHSEWHIVRNTDLRYKGYDEDDDETGGESTWMENHNQHPQVSQLQLNDEQAITDPWVFRIIMWRSPLHTVPVLLSLLGMQLALYYCSIISVLAWSGIAIMIGSAVYQTHSYIFKGKNETPQSVLAENNYATEAYSNVINLLLNALIPHQYCNLHSCEATHCPQDSLFPCDNENVFFTDKMSTQSLQVLQNFVVATRELLLLKRPMQSFKLAILLYLMTRIGALCNFSTLLFITTSLAFSVPKLYEMFKHQIHMHIDRICSIIREKITMLETRVGQLPVVGPYFISLTSQLPSTNTNAAMVDAANPRNIPTVGRGLRRRLNEGGE